MLWRNPCIHSELISVTLTKDGNQKKKYFESRENLAATIHCKYHFTHPFAFALRK